MTDALVCIDDYLFEDMYVLIEAHLYDWKFMAWAFTSRARYERLWRHRAQDERYSRIGCYALLQKDKPWIGQWYHEVTGALHCKKWILRQFSGFSDDVALLKHWVALEPRVKEFIMTPAFLASRMLGHVGQQYYYDGKDKYMGTIASRDIIDYLLANGLTMNDEVFGECVRQVRRSWSRFDDIVQTFSLGINPGIILLLYREQIAMDTILHRMDTKRDANALYRLAVEANESGLVQKLTKLGFPYRESLRDERWSAGMKARLRALTKQ